MVCLQDHRNHQYHTICDPACVTRNWADLPPKVLRVCLISFLSALYNVELCDVSADWIYFGPGSLLSQASPLSTDTTALQFARACFSDQILALSELRHFTRRRRLERTVACANGSQTQTPCSSTLSTAGIDRNGAGGPRRSQSTSGLYA